MLQFLETFWQSSAYSQKIMLVKTTFQNTCSFLKLMCSKQFLVNIWILINYKIAQYCVYTQYTCTCKQRSETTATVIYNLEIQRLDLYPSKCNMQVHISLRNFIVLWSFLMMKKYTNTLFKICMFCSTYYTRA